jgi:protein SCO1/2
MSTSALPTRPNVTWPAHARRAPDFRLVDERGAPISLRLYRGRPVILTFIDPDCRTLCPFEARVLNQVVSSVAPAKRPAVIAVSVNPWGDSRATFRKDGSRWHLVPQWHWAIGRYGKLAAVWKRYDIGVQASKRVVAGTTVHEVAHTEASFVIDPAGYERALYLYPFRADDVATTVRRIASARS